MKSRIYGALAAPFRQFWDGFLWWMVRGSVEAVRYRPRHLELVLACGASQPEVPEGLVRWVAEVRTRPAVRQLSGFPHAVVRALAAWAASWFGPTASAVVRWSSGAVAGVADQVGAGTLERPLRARAHPGLLVPHSHVVAVLAVDMRGYSNLTLLLDDTPYLTDLIGDYLSELTKVVESNRGVVFQYTGDGLLALFLPELAGVENSEMFPRLVNEIGAALHQTFDTLRARWQAQWEERGQDGVDVGLGVGLSFGEATIGFIGPLGKKQFGAIGAPVNLAAFLCSEAEPGTVLIDRDSFTRSGATPPEAKLIRLRSKKLRSRVETLRLEYGARRTSGASRWLTVAAPRSPSRESQPAE